MQYSQFSSLTKFTRKKVFRHITNVSFKVSIDLGKFQRISLHDVSSLHDKAKSTTNLLGRDGQNKATKGKDCSEGRKGVKAKKFLCAKFVRFCIKKPTTPGESTKISGVRVEESSTTAAMSNTGGSTNLNLKNKIL